MECRYNYQLRIINSSSVIPSNAINPNNLITISTSAPQKIIFLAFIQFYVISPRYISLKVKNIPTIREDSINPFLNPLVIPFDVPRIINNFSIEVTNTSDNNLNIGVTVYGVEVDSSVLGDDYFIKKIEDNIMFIREHYSCVSQKPKGTEETITRYSVDSTSSSHIATKNLNRVRITITNNSLVSIYYGPNSSITVLNNSSPLAAGGVYVIDDYIGDIYVIARSG